MVAWMLRSLALAVALGVPANPTLAQERPPVVPGLSGSHPLDETWTGVVLAGELRCGACHDRVAAFAPAPPGPDLGEVASRVRPEYLRAFLAAPRRVQPGTKMPDVLHALPESERAAAAEALTHFLVAESTSGVSGDPDRSDDPGDPGDPGDKSRGADLFHSVGCVACHAPRRPPEFASDVPAPHAGAVPLDHVSAKYGAAPLADFLFQPVRVRPAGRMPDMGLSRAEARDLAAFLAGEERDGAAFAVDRELVLEGARLFQAEGCSACHALDGEGPSPRSDRIEDPAGGCLDAGSSRGVGFTLDGSQRAALVRAVSGPVPPLSDEGAIATTLTALNCIACHVREDYGGVPEAIDAYFTTDERDLGDDARIPPPLTLAGAKLHGDWMRDVIFEGASCRDYMHTRMPRFGRDNVAHLPELLERADEGRVEPFPMPIPEREAKRVALDAGRELMGIQGLGCISCHDFNGIPSKIHGGVDLINSTTRLRPDWFARFLIAPEVYRPGVVMPQSWPDGVATHPGILNGDTEAQVRAIWTYLSEGRTARNPEGLRPAPSHLDVGDRPIVYRGRSSIAGYRGIAVGFPEGIHYAFHAQNGTLSALWRGDFVSARWDGQGAGDFNPRARAVQLAQDTSFLRMESATSPWPLAPVTTEDEPVNPDPTYPRNHGYRFRGYRLDADGVPTLRYESGAVAIEDRSVPTEIPSGVIVLRRTLTFTAPAAETIDFRVLTGAFEKFDAGTYRTDRLQVHLHDLPVERRARTDDRPADLLIRLDLPRGDSSITIDYELL